MWSDTGALFVVPSDTEIQINLVRGAWGDEMPGYYLREVVTTGGPGQLQTLVLDANDPSVKKVEVPEETTALYMSASSDYNLYSPSLIDEYGTARYFYATAGIYAARAMQASDEELWLGPVTVEQEGQQLEWPLDPELAHIYTDAWFTSSAVTDKKGNFRFGHDEDYLPWLSVYPSDRMLFAEALRGNMHYGYRMYVDEEDLKPGQVMGLLAGSPQRLDVRQLGADGVIRMDEPGVIRVGLLDEYANLFDYIGLYQPVVLQQSKDEAFVSQIKSIEITVRDAKGNEMDQHWWENAYYIDRAGTYRVTPAGTDCPGGSGPDAGAAGYSAGWRGRDVADFPP
ncbi:hypothetical protein IDH44_01795 [Paenibacillus sp. IB182496]|uniref:Uncharacterized protein n=1 Tax=Paenibacillus sabuli TaxID=2772509 RepID=A0A927BNQ4_9BACL|nr:hypothetical protein [Paenibacillus sabuli]MBD2843912.1 hypothetical protein [Paenibacillus sabuli]